VNNRRVVVYLIAVWLMPLTELKIAVQASRTTGENRAAR
jgi:hypothetical protein